MPDFLITLPNHPAAHKISGRALFLRLKRRLAHEGEILCCAREGTAVFNNLGRYYTLNTVQNSVCRWHISLEAEAIDLGVALTCVGTS